VTEEGIFMVYSGWGEDCVYKPGGVVFSKDDPGKLLQRMDKPLFEPAQDWGEKFGCANHVVAESLVKHGDSWLLYYGAADRARCLAIWEER
ncbi:MAG: glycosidase, partial [Chloroflexi bacterium]|nr:glycosidase [Chloroflexota bacterium]